MYHRSSVARGMLADIDLMPEKLPRERARGRDDDEITFKPSTLPRFQRRSGNVVGYDLQDVICQDRQPVESRLVIGLQSLGRTAPSAPDCFSVSGRKLSISSQG